MEEKEKERASEPERSRPSLRKKRIEEEKREEKEKKGTLVRSTPCKCIRAKAATSSIITFMTIHHKK